MLKALYFDVETTGLEPKEHDIVHLAMISEVDGVVKEEAEFFMRPLRMDNFSEDAMHANGMTQEQVVAFPEQKDVFPKVLAFLDRQVDKFDTNDKMYPVGYNVRFDISFVVELFKRHVSGPGAYFGSYVRWQDVDLLYLMYIHDFMGTHKLRNYKLETVAKAYGIKQIAHDALSDTRVVRELAHKFLWPYVKKENR